MVERKSVERKMKVTKQHLPERRAQDEVLQEMQTTEATKKPSRRTMVEQIKI